MWWSFFAWSHCCWSVLLFLSPHHTTPLSHHHHRPVVFWGRGFCMRFFCCLSTFSRLRKQIARAKVVESLKNPYRHHLHPFWIDLSVLSTSAWMQEGAIDHENDARCKEMMCADIQIFAYRCVVCGGPTRKLQKGFVVCYTHTQSPFLLPSFLDDFLPWLGRNELSTTPKLHKNASVKLFI